MTDDETQPEDGQDNPKPGPEKHVATRYFSVAVLPPTDGSEGTP
jgi:hypothetical protein